MEKKNLMLALAVMACMGCASLTPEAEHVKLVGPNSMEQLKACTVVEKITANKGFKFGSPSMTDRDRLVNGLKNQTAELGGNVVLTSGQTSRQFNGFEMDPTLSGRAYTCPEQIYTKLDDISDI